MTSTDAADRQRYERAGRALFFWLRDGAPRLDLAAFGADGAAVATSTRRALDELRANYRRGRELWAAGSHSAAAQLMADSAVVAIRLEQDIRQHAARVPAIARWLVDSVESRLMSDLRTVVNVALEPLNQAARGFGLGAGLTAAALLALTIAWSRGRG